MLEWQWWPTVCFGSTPRSPATYQENVIWSEFTTMASDQIKLEIVQFVLSDFFFATGRNQRTSLNVRGWHFWPLSLMKFVSWMKTQESCSFCLIFSIHGRITRRLVHLIAKCRHNQNINVWDTYILRYLFVMHFFTMFFFCRKSLITFTQR